MNPKGVIEMKEAAESTEIVVAPHPAIESATLNVSRPPQEVLDEARKAAQALADVLDKKKKKVTFNNETYLEFEDWQTLGRFYGITAQVDNTAYVEYDMARGFEARASALHRGQVISSAEAICLDDERNWAGKPLFQLRSMAQTRALAKTLRNVLAWVVVLAGYRPTPAEEMNGVLSDAPAFKQPTRASERTPQAPPPPQQTASAPRQVSEAQIKKLWAVAREAGWKEPEVKALLGRYGYQHTKDIAATDLDAILSELERGEAIPF